jgi:CTP synthase
MLTRLHADHPYFVAFQAHPEFCSRPLNPSPPFLGLIAAASDVSKRLGTETPRSSVFKEQLESQSRNFQPPHPVSAMKLEVENIILAPPQTEVGAS